LLRGCSELKILATSRERLGIEGEVVYRVPSRGRPDGKNLEDVRECDSMKLFVERAHIARPGFEISSDNFEPAAAICRRLDGIPLALELAASRLRVLSTEQIAARLDERFRVLGASGRGVPERHRTLQATIDWSHDLLTEPEREIFRRVSVFAGDFDLEAAEAVCADEPVDASTVLDLLTELIDRSMLVSDDEFGKTARYRMLESMRHYGADRLVEASESSEASARHAAHYADVGESLQSVQRAGDLGGALAALDRDEDNVRAALRFSLDHGLAEYAARIVGAVGYLWYTIGSFREGIGWCQELFDTEPDLSDELLAPALHAYGTLLGSWAQHAEGIEILKREVTLRRRLGDPARLAASLNNLGNLLNDQGQTAAAESTLHEAIERFRAAGESATLALSSLGYGYLHAGDYDRAAQTYEEALAEAVADADRYGIALATAYLGQCAAHREIEPQARAQLEEGRTGFVELGVSPGVAYVDVLLGLVDRAAGDRPACSRHLVAALEYPDAHWYLAVKFWILQFAAGLIEDDRLAASLVGVAEQYYDSVDEIQPAFVTEDLVATRARLVEALGTDQFVAAATAGRRLAPATAVASTVHELELIAAG
jgi:predicted ATPase